MDDDDLEIREISEDISQGEPSGTSIIRRPVKKSRFIANLRKTARASKTEAESLYKKLSDPANKEKAKRLMANLKAASEKGKKAYIATKKDVKNIRKELGISDKKQDWFESSGKSNSNDWFEKRPKRKSKKDVWF